MKPPCLCARIEPLAPTTAHVAHRLQPAGHAGRSVKFCVDGRNEATGLGLYYCARNILDDPHYLQKAGLEAGIAGKTFIVQGFGNVGSWFARFIHENGGIVQGIVEYNGSIYNKDGLDIHAL